MLWKSASALSISKLAWTFDPGAFPIELDAVTPLNVRAVLLLKTKDGRELLASCSEDQATQFGRGHRQVWANLKPQDMLYFEPETGMRLL